MSRRMVWGVTEKCSASASMDMKPRWWTRLRICCWRVSWDMGSADNEVDGFRNLTQSPFSKKNLACAPRAELPMTGSLIRHGRRRPTMTVGRGPGHQHDEER